eukprot:scaffold35698_cov63-Attheya_sp.AAC.23
MRVSACGRTRGGGVRGVSRHTADEVTLCVWQLDGRLLASIYFTCFRFGWFEISRCLGDAGI